MTVKHPTVYDEVNAVVGDLVTAVQNLLDEQLVGVYLHGSLALGDFDPQQSDIDFVVVTAEAPSPEQVAELGAMHQRLAAEHPRWGSELEGTYVSQRAIQRYDPDNAIFPHIERGGILQIEHHLTDWVIQCYVLRECGVTLVGPRPQTLIDPISPEALQQAVVTLLRDWWVQQLEDTSRIKQDGYQVYAILTMCRILYTLAHGMIVSKPVAARWAQESLDERWSLLIARALHRDLGDGGLNSLRETKAFIRYTLKRSQMFA